MEFNDTVKLKLKTLPESPGCYLMRDGDTIIYVGKAKNLKNRVRQYFQSGSGHTAKVRAMVARVSDFDIILCQTNMEAFILECNLIKRHRPYYNIMLRDDKQYPFVRIDLSADFPRVELVRKASNDGAKYFGPYFGTQSVREVLDLLRQIFPLRTCALALPDNKIHRPCIQYEMGNCLAPCAVFCTRDEYHRVVKDAMRFLSGKADEILSELNGKMNAAAASLEYEKAGKILARIRAVEKLIEKQTAHKAGGGDRDIIAVARDQGNAMDSGLPSGKRLIINESSPDAIVQLLFVRGGQIIGADSFVLERAGDETTADILQSFMMQYYTEAALIPREIVLPELPVEHETLSQLLCETRGKKTELIVPVRGERHEQLVIAVKNAADALAKRAMREGRKKERTTGAAADLGRAVGLDGALRRIECYDISNTQGVLSVASMVVFIDGEPAKKEYRRFRIKTVEGANDFASMAEVLGRRFTHGLAELAERREQGLDVQGGKFSDMPDLVVIDGGPEQLEFARNAMFEAGGNAPIISLAKRLEEIFLPNQPESIYLPRSSPALHLIERIRDEAHRFAITYHRGLRQGNMTKSILEEIDGVGEKRRRALFAAFRTLAEMKKATVEELAAVNGMNRSAAVKVHEKLRVKN
jgi:excinuclease ABC subunit C